MSPTVSVIAAAHNEATNIEKRLQNLVAQEYPADRLEIIIVSDGSTDQTNALVRQFISRNTTLARIKLIESPINMGKPNALNKGASEVTGEVIVMADARQRFAPNVIAELVANFADEDVACVSGELVFHDATDSKIEKEMGLYWNYEKCIRKTEGRIDSVVGVTRAIYAIRASCFRPIATTNLSSQSTVKGLAIMPLATTITSLYKSPQHLLIKWARPSASAAMMTCGCSSTRNSLSISAVYMVR